MAAGLATGCRLSETFLFETRENLGCKIRQFRRVIDECDRRAVEPRACNPREFTGHVIRVPDQWLGPVPTRETHPELLEGIGRE